MAKKSPTQLQREIDKALSDDRYKVFEYRNQKEPVAAFRSLAKTKAYALERSAHRLKWDTRREQLREGTPLVTAHYSDDRYFILEA